MRRGKGVRKGWAGLRGILCSTKKNKGQLKRGERGNVGIIFAISELI